MKTLLGYIIAESTLVVAAYCLLSSFVLPMSYFTGSCNSFFVFAKLIARDVRNLKKLAQKSHTENRRMQMEQKFRKIVCDLSDVKQLRVTIYWRKFR